MSDPKEPTEQDLATLLSAPVGAAGGIATLALLTAGLMIVLREKGIVSQSELDGVLRCVGDDSADEVRKAVVDHVSVLVSGSPKTRPILTVIEGGKD